MQVRRILRVPTCLLTFGVQESTQPVSVDASLVQVRSVWLGRTITGTGLKKWRPVAVHKYIKRSEGYYSPITRAVLAFPASDAAVSPDGIAAAAILVMLIEEVLVANMVSGRTSAVSNANKDVFSWTFSAAA